MLGHTGHRQLTGITVWDRAVTYQTHTFKQSVEGKAKVEK